MGLSQNYWREDQTLARKRLELVIVGARSASLSQTHPIANVPLWRDIQSSGEIPLLIRCRCSDGDRRFNLWLEEAEIRGRLRRQSRTVARFSFLPRPARPASARR
jgi:hypothetical protein